MRPTKTYDNFGNLIWGCSTHLGHPTYEDSLIEVCNTWTGSCLYFPYLDDRNIRDGWEDHVHSFEHLLMILIKDDNAKHISIDKFEQYYGETEIDLFNRVKRKLLEEMEG